MRAIKIDTANMKIIEIENTGLKSLQKAVGGTITLAYEYPDGSACFVNDEGLFDQSLEFFTSHHGYQPYAGNGVIVGPVDINGNSTDCTLTIEEIKKTTRFCSREFIKALALSQMSHRKNYQ